MPESQKDNRRTGALAKYGEKGIQEAIDWGYKKGEGDVSEPLEVPTKPAHKPKKSVRRRRLIGIAGYS